MNHLKEKSENNIKAADILLKKSVFSSSVHCSYYSSVQLILHILRSDFKKTDDEINILSKKKSKENNGLHNWLQNFVSLELFNRKNFDDARSFNNYFGQLKGSRVKSDYKNKAINNTSASQALDKAKSINEIITNNFSL